MNNGSILDRGIGFTHWGLGFRVGREEGKIVHRAKTGIHWEYSLLTTSKSGGFEPQSGAETLSNGCRRSSTFVPETLTLRLNPKDPIPKPEARFFSHPTKNQLSSLASFKAGSCMVREWISATYLGGRAPI